MLLLLRLVYTYGVDLGGESVEIDKEIDSSVGKCAHASLVVTARIDVVDTDRIRSQSLHELRIVAALVVVDQRVIGSELVGDTCDRVRNCMSSNTEHEITFDEELLAVTGEELGTFSSDCRNG